MLWITRYTFCDPFDITPPLRITLEMHIKVNDMHYLFFSNAFMLKYSSFEQ
ncbi:hypothetical protein D3C74_497910 [compost metagenome]